MADDLTEHLHDEIDATEELLERTANVVRATLLENLQAAIDAAGNDLPKALEYLALAVGEELTDLTTEAMQTGGEHGRKRWQISR